MSGHIVLDHVLKDIIKVITPLHEDWVVRLEIVEDLRRVVESVENFRGATVEPFGSFVSNLFTRWSDLDISIELPNGSHISSAGKKRKQMLLGDLLRALRIKGGCSSLQFISHARVPILKFRSNRQGISCDISIDNLLGQMKSKVLLWISMMDSRFHDMVLLVKEWAKVHKINNSKTGTFNSYSLSLLVIFHFQTCIPAILPPLKDIYPGNIADDLRGVRADAEKLIEETCQNNIKFLSNRPRPINRKPLSELFIEFLEKFSDINSKAELEGICTYNGQWELINNNTRWQPKTFAIFIEDPLEQPVNSARSVSKGQLTKIAEAFKSTHRSLTSVNASRGSLIRELVPPHVAQFMRVSNNQGYSGGYYHQAISPQTPPRHHGTIWPQGPMPSRAMVHRPQHSNRHFVHVNQEASSNNTSRGHVQAPQRQQIWRQKTR
ncbi:protein HESO1 isoform X1 [Prosopis cineraria]|uniref:protein HESO1 isoform X1 n=1 Tax=Prosopis cineraria TaxID=364024 RepID=UPI002410649C|nr:protein HESO1 isoform X1 [Prosopis cineraria]XP_054798934.1 protein HESO1 isoform X1 [Prosopis cineraria]XP_054798935.1 protein HESO1 isoform X1 [Prosopis cineraria]